MIPVPTSIWQIIIPAVVILGVAGFIRLFMPKQPTDIRIPIIKGPPRSNWLGTTLHGGTCPECGHDYFFVRVDMLCCDKCKTAYRVFNYGHGQVWAEIVN